jgi:6-phosphogluconolactonase
MNIATVGLIAAMQVFVYFGTYTRGESKGIYVSRFDSSTGELSEPVLAAEMVNPSFLALHPNRRFLYAVGETSGSGAVKAFAINPADGTLKLLNETSSGGDGPCFITVDRTGRSVLVANYGGGSISSYPLMEDGRLGESASFIQHTGSSVNASRQSAPHAHSINVSPDNRFAVVADLGLDKLLVYRFDPAKAKLEPNDPPFATVNPGAGPRHFTFHPGGKFAYVINEMQSTVTALTWEAGRGEFKEIHTVTTLPEGFEGKNSTAEVQVHPGGKFLYGSNRGHNSIAVFSIDPSTGRLTPIEHVSTEGRTPRNFGIDPTGSWLFAANQASKNVVLFRIDSATGRLTPAGKSVTVDTPVCVKFLAPR